MPTMVRLVPLAPREAMIATATGAARIVAYRLAALLRVATFLAPLNGQERRREAVAAIAADFAPDAVIETGTFLGDSTRHFAEWAPTVFSAELDPSFIMTARLRLRGLTNVTLALGDSRHALRYVAQRRGAARPLIYLDSHWYGDLPLPEEVEIIAGNWTDAIVVIDDFAVPDDPGYGYDDYGARRVDLEACAFGAEWAPFFPGQPATEETGHARGTCYAGIGEGRST